MQENDVKEKKTLKEVIVRHLFNISVAATVLSVGSLFVKVLVEFSHIFTYTHLIIASIIGVISVFIMGYVYYATVILPNLNNSDNK